VPAGAALPSAGLGVLVGVAILLLDLWVFAPRLAGAGSDTAALQPPACKGYWPRSTVPFQRSC
jgi:hypothetical protein